MARKEPKLRPSMSWSEISLAVTALDNYIRNAVATSNVNKQTLDMIMIKEYLESFKPTVNIATDEYSLVQLLAQYQDSPTSTPAPVSLTEPVPTIPLTDDERYDILKLRKESTYSAEDKVFMLNVGTMIMMKRAMGKPVNEGDL